MAASSAEQSSFDSVQPPPVNQANTLPRPIYSALVFGVNIVITKFVT